MSSRTVFQRPDDPYIYLLVMGEWYCYDPTSSPLGSGAMGTVYIGYRVKDGARMAIKRVKDSYANNPMIRERARQEASLAFRHKNLIEMIGYCEYAPSGGPIFLVSKFVSGKNIDDYAREFLNGPDRVEKICNAIMQVLDALEYVHSRGVIHRDIKPSNIMVEADSNIRLMDLGIARMNDGNKFSRYGFIGTPQYSAPEQILRDKNRTVQINAATDLYALGITLYELLTGDNPFDADTEVDTLTRQMRESLPAHDAIPKRVMAVIAKATEKEQSKRFQTAAEFRDALREALLPPKSMFQRFKDWIGFN
ncbi:MAG: serine/threonine protein kinase [Pseudoflavonifractor sp.]|nr:serine/threonine protein kinase [Pseudoflavonifractor sp.]